MLVWAWTFEAFASPWDDPTIRLLERWSRMEPVDQVRGGTLRDPLTWAYRAERFGLPTADDALGRIGASQVVLREYAVEVARAGCATCDPFPWRIAPAFTAAGGNLVPDYEGGDEEPGLLSARARGDVR